jgi:hypothetical protein
MLLIHRTNLAPRGLFKCGHLKFCWYRQVTKDRVAAALATSVKWGDQLTWNLVAGRQKKLGYPGFGSGQLEGRAEQAWGV